MSERNDHSSYTVNSASQSTTEQQEQVRAGNNSSPATTIAIIGGAGDLAKKLLLPGIAEYAALSGTNVRIIGADMADDVDYPAYFAAALEASGTPTETLSSLIAQSTYFQVDATSAADLQKLMDVATEQQVAGPILYFALPPMITARALKALEGVKLPDGVVLALEKPIGESLETARAVNEQLAKLVGEEQIFRVDHFLGLSGTVNIEGLRESNMLIDPIWNAQHIDEVRIVFNETIGLEGRAAFYDKTGAAVDMIQSHLIQVMSHVLADEDTSPSEILRMSKAVEARRGRYTAGTVSGKELPSYVDEPGVDRSRNTETWARIQLAVDTDRWRGIPIILESGKGIGHPRREISAVFRQTQDGAPANVLRLSFESDELGIEVNANDPSDPDASEWNARITLSSGLVPSKLGAYGRVARSLLTGEKHLRLTAAAAEEGWRIIEPVLESYDSLPLEEYEAGTTPGQ